jgi:hypothetical protein
MALIEKMHAIGANMSKEHWKYETKHGQESGSGPGRMAARVGT